MDSPLRFNRSDRFDPMQDCLGGQHPFGALRAIASSVERCGSWNTMELPGKPHGTPKDRQK